MKNPQTSIVFEAGRYIGQLFEEYLSSDLLFHNYHHTLNVVRGATVIGSHTGLDTEQREILLLAAWFHDSGHIIRYKGHERESQKLAKSFLEKHGYPAEKTRQVLDCIDATRMPQQPHTLMQQAMCDADLFHLSMTEYPFLQQQLWEEWARVFGRVCSDEEWSRENISFLKNHRYFTPYGQVVLEKRKRVNLEYCKKTRHLKMAA